MDREFQEWGCIKDVSGDEMRLEVCFPSDMKPMMHITCWEMDTEEPYSGLRINLKGSQMMLDVLGARSMAAALIRFADEADRRKGA